MKRYLVFEHFRNEYNGMTTIHCGTFDSEENAKSWVDSNSKHGDFYSIKESFVEKIKTKVYLVLERFADEDGLNITYYGIFSSKEKAESWIDLHKSLGSTYDIEENIVDEDEVENTEEPIKQICNIGDDTEKKDLWGKSDWYW